MQQKQNPPSKILSIIGILTMSAIFSIMGLMLLSEDTAQAQNVVANGGVKGIPDQVEYLHSLNFFDTDGYTIHTNFQAVDSEIPTLYVSGTMTVGSSNNNTNSSFIGGGKNNDALGVNATVLGGDSNKAPTADSLIMGGVGNKISGSANAFIGGGENNTIDTPTDSAFILGGKQNTLKGDGIILGMQGNTIEGGSNNIVAGSKIKISANLSNTLVWSDMSKGTFSPTASGALYLNSANGVGINEPGPAVKFDSKGAIKFGGVEVKCDASSVGVVIYKNGQLCGCNPRGYWTSLSDDPAGVGASICNDGNPCTYNNTTKQRQGTCGAGKCVSEDPNASFCDQADAQIRANTGVTIVDKKENCTTPTKKCQMFCNTDFHKKSGENKCVSNYEIGSCPVLSGTMNAIYINKDITAGGIKVGTGEFKKTRNGSAYLPTTGTPTHESYFAQDTLGCVYTCKSGYTFEGGKCINTKTNQACTGLLANAVWNTATSITQTWTGNAWKPSTTGSYNTTASTSECRFKCNSTSTYNSTNKTCVANTRYSSGWSSCSASCGGGTQTQTVQCRDYNGNGLSDSACGGSKPGTSQPCNTQSCCDNSGRTQPCNSNEFTTDISQNGCGNTVYTCFLYRKEFVCDLGHECLHGTTPYAHATVNYYKKDGSLAGTCHDTKGVNYSAICDGSQYRNSHLGSCEGYVYNNGYVENGGASNYISNGSSCTS